MADNYLEKKMEEHRNGGAPSYRRKYTSRGTRPGEWIVKFTPCDVWFPDCETVMFQQLAREMVGVGFRVSFTMADNRAGSLFAQQSGCRFIPSDVAATPEAAAAHGEALAVTFAADGAVSLTLGDLTSVLTVDALPGLTDSPAVELTEAPADGHPCSSLLLQNILLEAVNLVNFNRSAENMLGNIKISRKKL